MPYVTIEELRALRVAMLRGHEENSAQLSVRVPKELVELARQAGGDRYQDELRRWLWAGAVATAAEQAEGFRARFSLNLMENGTRSVSLLRYDQGRMLGRVTRPPQGGRVSAWFEARFHPAMVADPNFAYRLSEMAAALQNHALQEFTSGGAKVYDKTWILWKPGPAHVQAEGRSVEALDGVLTSVAEGADTMLEHLYREGKKFEERPDWLLMRDDSILSTDPRVRESIERAARESDAAGHSATPPRRKRARG